MPLVKFMIPDPRVADREIGQFLDHLARLSQKKIIKDAIAASPRPLHQDRSFMKIAMDDCMHFLEMVSVAAKKNDMEFGDDRLPTDLYEVFLKEKLGKGSLEEGEAQKTFSEAVSARQKAPVMPLVPDFMKVLLNSRDNSDVAAIVDDLQGQWSKFLNNTIPFFRDKSDFGVCYSVGDAFSSLLQEQISAAKEDKEIKFESSNIDQPAKSAQGIDEEVAKRVQQEMQKSQQIYFLRTKLEILDEVKTDTRNALKALGEEVEGESEIEKFEALIAKKQLPPDVLDRVKSELDRLKTPGSGAEQTVSRNWLNEVLKLPWGAMSKTNSDIPHAKQVLDETHYGLEKVKERVLESLAVLSRQGASTKGGTLIFDGPAGTGKTSIGESIAKATGRNFVLVSLGGGSDAHAIKGHSRTYIGAARGKIIKALQDAGTDNCVIMLDEIEKLATNSAQGDPMAALLAVLDPEQNKAFVDDYLDIPYDLSKVLFIANSNSLEPLSFPLLNRMEVVKFEGYGKDEKQVIAKKYLLPKQMKDKALSANEFSVSDDALTKIIDDYTQEMGVRSIDKAIAKLARKAALKMATGEAAKVDVTASNLEDFLGSDTVEHPKIPDEDEVGHTNGMAWTQVGGDLLAVECSINPNTNRGVQITATGHLGQDMTESGSKAVTAIRNFLDKHSELKDRVKRPLDNADVHIDAPTVVPKDGPSAGITMSTCLLSKVFDIAVRRTVSMTGEITTLGKVLPIGGLDRKIPAA
ncbi:MAG TPA: S16 family serine protease, partial [Patescibacteria group bacterium]|nr:S16 family serine protease [Patescibacteria group bacterium]